jgi:hypothetical protein
VQVDDASEAACRRLSLESKSSTLDGGDDGQLGALPDADKTLKQASSSSGHIEEPQEQQAEQQMSGWPQDDDMVVIQDWDDSSLAQYDASDVNPTAAEQAADAAGAAAAEEQKHGMQQQEPTTQSKLCFGQHLHAKHLVCS